MFLVAVAESSLGSDLAVAEIAGSGEGSDGAHSFAAGLGKELIRAAGWVAAQRCMQR